MTDKVLTYAVWNPDNSTINTEGKKLSRANTVFTMFYVNKTENACGCKVLLNHFSLIVIFSPFKFNLYVCFKTIT